MPDFPTSGHTAFIEAPVTASLTYPSAAVAADSSADTKGSFVELIASSDFDAAGLVLTIRHADADEVEYLLDVCVGGVGSEQVVIPDVLAFGIFGTPSGDNMWFPISIPKGSRVSARVQASTGSSEVRVGCALVGNSAAFPSAGVHCEAYGVDTANTTGVTVDPGGSANTKGSWAQITGSTTKPIRHLIGIVSQLNTAMSTYDFALDVGVGAAASEQPIVQNLMIRIEYAEDIMGNHFSIPITIPEGVRLAARLQCNGTDATDRVLKVALYGIS